MDGLIAFEEHWAIPETLGSFAEANDVDGNWRDVRRRLLDVHDMRLADMDRHGIEMTILSLNSPAVQGILDVGEAIETARRANDALAGEIAKHPDRFAGFAALPMQDPDAAIDELTRCIRDLVLEVSTHALHPLLHAAAGQVQAVVLVPADVRVQRSVELRDDVDERPE